VCVGEFERIIRRERDIVLHQARTEKQFQALRCSQPEMVPALRTDAPVGIHVFLPHNRPAIFALCPQPFRLCAARIGRRRLVDSFFPRLNHAIVIESWPVKNAAQASACGFWLWLNKNSTD
jgi:hypothetical protein